jgi:hypothetical protein
MEWIEHGRLWILSKIVWINEIRYWSCSLVQDANKAMQTLSLELENSILNSSDPSENGSFSLSKAECHAQIRENSPIFREAADIFLKHLQLFFTLCCSAYILPLNLSLTWLIPTFSDQSQFPVLTPQFKFNVCFILFHVVLFCFNNILTTCN